MLNRCEFIGRLGKAVEAKTMPNGDPVVNFSLACSEKWTDKNSGERREKTEWINVVCFDERLCKTMQAYLKKGSLVRVVGKWQTRSWEKDGVTHYRTECVLQRFRGELTMLDGRSEGDSRQASTNQNDDYTRAHNREEIDAARKDFRRAQDLDDEIPFS